MQDSWRQTLEGELKTLHQTREYYKDTGPEQQEWPSIAAIHPRVINSKEHKDMHHIRHKENNK